MPTISWEAKREGIDDYRYLLALSRFVAKAKAAADGPVAKLAAEAQADVDAVMGRIPIDAYRRRYEQVGPGFVRPWPAIDTEEYDRFRRIVAGWIVRLQTELDRKEER